MAERLKAAVLKTVVACPPGVRIPFLPPENGAWRSLVAHLLWEQGVEGSNPFAPTRDPIIRETHQGPGVPQISQKGMFMNVWPHANLKRFVVAGVCGGSIGDKRN